MKTLNETVSYTCEFCQHNFSVPYTGWKQTTPCAKCGMAARMDSLRNSFSNLEVSVKQFNKEPVAFWRTPSGEEVATDANGKILDQTRYDTKRDPHGWKATGKKVRYRDKQGRING